MTRDLFAALHAVWRAGFTIRLANDGTASTEASDPDDVRRIEDICEGFMVEVIRSSTCSRLTIRAVGHS